MLRTCCIFFLAFAVFCTASPCTAADLEAACAKFHSCYNGGGHDVCWKRHESELLSKRDAEASREGSSLYVMTLRGPVIFTDTLSDAHVEGAYYRYLGYYPDIQQHLVGIIYYEGNNYVLVSNTTAEAVFTGDAPHVSPSRQRIVVANASESYTPNQIKVWALESGRLRLEHSEPFKTIVARFVRWEDDASFTVDEFDNSRSADCPNGKYAEQHYTYRWGQGVLSRSVAKNSHFRCEDNW